MKNCTVNSVAISCKECMEGAPYKFCCTAECNEHEFCRNCSYKSKYIPKTENGFVTVTLKTMTEPGLPNVNGITYSKQVFDEYIKNKGEENFKLVNEPYPIKKDKIYYINTKNIIGDVIGIKHGEIDVKVPEYNFNKLQDLINDGYKPGMRYSACIKNNIVNKINHIISFDMIKLPNEEKGEN